MPELPEAEVVRQGLADHVVGRVFSRAQVRGSRVARRYSLGPDHLADLLVSTRVLAVDRRGKYLWMVMQPEQSTASAVGREVQQFALLVHLGMSGQMLVQREDMAEPPHTHAVFALATGVEGGVVETGSVLRFVDQRTFGGLAVSELSGPVPGHPFGIPRVIGHIAPDPLEEEFVASRVAARMKGSKSGVKRLLLNQNVVSGVGNIYADESLWRARVHGERPASALTKPALERLLAHAADVMRESLQQGGTSFDALYVNVEGDSGYFARSLNVYGREGMPCMRCETPVRREQFMNRSSYSCPRCQVRPRSIRAL